MRFVPALCAPLPGERTGAVAWWKLAGLLSGYVSVSSLISESAHFLCQHQVSGTLRPSPSWSVSCHHRFNKTSVKFYERRCGAVEDGGEAS